MPGRTEKEGRKTILRRKSKEGRFRLFSKKGSGDWVFEVIDRKGDVVGTFPSVPMAERKVKEIGGGNVRPRRCSPEEFEEVKKASKRRKGTGTGAKGKKSQEGPVLSTSSGTVLVKVTGQQIRDFAEIHCAIGGNIPLVQNPMIVLDESRVAAYKCDIPLGLDLFTKVKDPQALLGSSALTRKVIAASDLKRIAKNFDQKQLYEVSLSGDKLFIGNNRYGCSIEVKEDSIPTDPFRIDLDTYCWATTGRFYKSMKEIAKSCEYATIAMEKDGFIHLYGEDGDGKPVMKSAIGTGVGYSVHTSKSTFNTKMLLKVASMFRKVGEVKIEIEDDYPVKFTFDIEGRKYQAMIAPRIG